jgi:NitT/TauT family transport system substrate-binding protein
MGKFTRRDVVRLTAATAAYGLGGSRAFGQETPLRVACSTADTYAQAIYAEGTGAFRQAGLNAEVVKLPNTGAIAAAVAGGSIDIGIGSGLTIAGGREQGLPFAMIAPGAVFLASAPTTLLVVAKDSPLKSPRELESKVIAADNLRGLTEVGIKAWLQRNGADPSRPRYVELPFSTMGAALATGHIDAGLIAEPALTASSAQTREFGNPYAAIANEWYICAWYVTKDWLAKNEATARTFAQVITRTSAWANSPQRESAPMLQKYLPIPDGVLTTMHRARFSERLDPAIMQPVLDAGVKGGVLQGSINAKELIAPGFTG